MNDDRGKQKNQRKNECRRRSIIQIDVTRVSFVFNSIDSVICSGVAHGMWFPCRSFLFLFLFFLSLRVEIEMIHREQKLHLFYCLVESILVFEMETISTRLLLTPMSHKSC